MDMDDATLRQRVLQHSVRTGDRLELSCDCAHRLAAELGVEVRRIGAVCMADNIRIVDCQLGCFGGRHGR